MLYPYTAPNDADHLSSTFRFAILAMSLANQFDQPDPSDYLARTLAVLGEYEASREEGDRPKMGVRRCCIIIHFTYINILYSVYSGQEPVRVKVTVSTIRRLNPYL